MTSTQQLTDIVLDEVSLVDKGANQHAHVILHKRAPEGEAMTTPLEKADMKREGGKEYPKGDFAYTPGSPSTWKLRLTSAPGGDPDPRIVGAAVAALGPTGYRGQKVQIPAADLMAVKRKVAAAWRKANPDKSAKDMPAALKKALDDMSDAEVDDLLEKALSFNEAYNGEMADEKLEELLEAFKRSLMSIASDPEITNRSAAVAQSAAQFHAAVAALAKEYDMSGNNQDGLMKQLTEKVTKLEADLAAAEEANTKLTADLEAATATEGAADTAIDKSALPEPVRKALEEAEAIKKRADEQEARIQKMEDERLEKSWNDRIGDNATGNLLFRVAKADAALADEVHATISALRKQAEAAGLFKSFGSDRGSEGETALEKVNKQAGDYAKQHNVSHSVAVTKVLEQDPKLYADYRAEQN